jgi:hypothetical protein
MVSGVFGLEHYPGSAGHRSLGDWRPAKQM